MEKEKMKNEGPEDQKCSAVLVAMHQWGKRPNSRKRRETYRKTPGERKSGIILALDGRRVTRRGKTGQNIGL